MSCAKESAVNYLVSRNLVKPTMELYSQLPTKRLSDAIDYLTNLAKSKYKVDMGDLFRLRFRDVQVGNYLTLGSASVVTKIRLETNDAAFEAIDRSKTMETMEMYKKLNEQNAKRDRKIEAEYINIQEEGNYILNSNGDISVPANLPKINVRC